MLGIDRIYILLMNDIWWLMRKSYINYGKFFISKLYILRTDCFVLVKILNRIFL